LLPDGETLVVGGLQNYGTLSSAELYDEARNHWRTVAELSTPRQIHTATLLPNGTVLIAGGLNNDNQGTVLASAELFEHVTAKASGTSKSVR